MNEQLTKEQYEEKMKAIDTGSDEKLQQYLAMFKKQKAAYPKRYMIGKGGEDISGNMIFNSQGVEHGYDVRDGQNCVNVFNILNGGKDCLDVAAYGLSIEQIYNSITIGSKATNIRYSWSCYGNVSDLEYCAHVSSGSNHCFGCGFAKKLEYAILNKPLGEETYTKTVAELKQRMTERGEYGQLFRPDLIPHAYNETIAQLNMPLTREEAIARGFRWADRKIPAVPTAQLFLPPDHINDVTWEDVNGKVIICAESKRPFKIVKPEFDFYKRFNITLPRLHPDVRLEKRYPRELFFDLRDVQCDGCKATLKTSMPSGDKVLCETCYHNAVT